MPTSNAESGWVKLCSLSLLLLVSYKEVKKVPQNHTSSNQWGMNTCYMCEKSFGVEEGEEREKQSPRRLIYLLSYTKTYKYFQSIFTVCIPFSLYTFKCLEDKEAGVQSA